MDHRSPRLVVSAVAFALVLAVSACSSDDPAVVEPPPAATLAQLLGPWQPTPYALDLATWNRIEDGCRRDVQLLPATRALIIDVRGASVATVAMTGPQDGHCDALQLLPTGEIAGAGGGMSSGGPQQQPLLPATAIGPVQQAGVEGGDLAVVGRSAYGAVGSGIATVTVEVPGQPRIVATVMNGQFAAWWPSPAALQRPDQPGRGQVAPQLVAPPGLVVRGYDATGTLVNQVSQ